MALHAKTLTITIDGGALTFEAPLPSDLVEPLKAMQLL
jgi:hypothetical protein